MNFKNKVVLITGGSSGIGKETALLFARNGADIIISYKENKIGADEVVNEIIKMGNKAIGVQADLNDENQAKKLVDETIKNFGKIDILINNAGRYIDGDEWNGTEEIWWQSLQQNLLSAMSVSKYVIQEFAVRRSGIIVSVASRFGINGQADSLAYGVAKAGIINITQAYAGLMQEYGRANCVSPSAVKTGYWLTAPAEELALQKNLIDPKTVAEKILFLASEDASEINGQNFIISNDSIV